MRDDETQVAHNVTWLAYNVTWLAYRQVSVELDEAIVQRDRARSLACRLEEELALIRRAAKDRRHG